MGTFTNNLGENQGEGETLENIFGLDKREPVPLDLRGKVCAIFVDYRNFIFKSQDEEIKRLQDLRQQEELMRQQGGVIKFAMVFLPYSDIARASVQMISNIFHYDVMTCPQEVAGGIVKDADKVDSHIRRWVRLLEPQVDHFIVVAGDADFYRQSVDEWRMGKDITIVSGSKELPKRFKTLEGLDGISIKEV